ncbi:MAG TPA: class I SAM-dependent methyltransferase [Thermoplasmata archaeon]
MSVGAGSHLDPARYDLWYERPFGKHAHEFELKAILEAMGELHSKLVLEVGCGTGRFTMPVSETECQLVAIDSSRDMIRFARHRADSGHHDVDFVIADAEHMPFSPCVFDVAFSVTVLCVAEDARRIATETLRVTKSEGTIVSGELNRHSIHYLDKRLRDKIEGLQARDIRFFTPRELSALWRSPDWKTFLFASDSCPKPILSALRKLEPILMKGFASSGLFVVVRTKLPAEDRGHLSERAEEISREAGMRRGIAPTKGRIVEELIA